MFDKDKKPTQLSEEDIDEILSEENKHEPVAQLLDEEWDELE